MGRPGRRRRRPREIPPRGGSAVVDRVAAPAAATARAPRPPLARKEAPAMALAPHADLHGMCPPRPRRGCETSTPSRPSPWDPPRDSPTRPPAASTRPARPRTRNKSANAKISAITTSPNCNRIPAAATHELRTPSPPQNVDVQPAPTAPSSPGITREADAEATRLMRVAEMLQTGGKFILLFVRAIRD
jgi:hypothetical protein